MFGSGIASGLTIGKIASGISKTLGIVNQAIPIYREVKPIIGNARNMFSIIKEFGGTANKVTSTATNNINNNITPQKKIEQNNSTLTFFQ